MRSTFTPRPASTHAGWTSGSLGSITRCAFSHLLHLLHHARVESARTATPTWRTLGARRGSGQRTGTRTTGRGPGPGRGGAMADQDIPTTPHLTPYTSLTLLLYMSHSVVDVRVVDTDQCVRPFYGMLCYVKRQAAQRAAGLRDLDARVSRRHGPRDVPVPLWEGSRCWDPGD